VEYPGAGGAAVTGAGKSALLTAMGLINPPTSGRIVIGGVPVLDGPQPLLDLRAFRRKNLMDLFRKVAHERGSAVIVVTHDHRSLDVFDRTLEMEDGRLR
jgi:ABC-type lipoprotein export system ATPase subunit